MDLMKLSQMKKRFGNSIQICTPLIILSLSLSLTYAQPINGSISNPTPKKDQSQSASSPNEGSAERMKRQLFREQIPHHRPLSGNLYAGHHGFPHPGRWHANQQQILRPNYNSGLHFDNPNVILTDDDFNRYGSTLQHIDNHRIHTNPQPILHEYPTEFAKVIPLDQGQNTGHQYQVPEEVPLIATHHHIHHEGNSQPYGVPPQQQQQYEHVEHGHAVIHDYNNHGGQGNYGHQPNKYLPQPPVKSKPFFGFKLPQFLSHKNFGVHPILKGIWSGGGGGGGGRYGGGGSGPYKRRGGAISWSSVEQQH